MRIKILFFLLVLCSLPTIGQVGIGTILPDPSAALEVKSANKGILIPRIELLNDTDQTSIESGNINSLLVYNLTRNQTLKEGFYYWFYDHWEPLKQELLNPDRLQNPVVWDPGKQAFSYRDAHQDFHQISPSFSDALTDIGLNSTHDGLAIYSGEYHFNLSLTELIKSQETVTTFLKNKEGAYVYTNEVGEMTIFDPQNAGSSEDFSSTLEFDAATSQLFYKNGKDQKTTVDLSELKGRNGLSAYEIAVENGFNGDQEDWLDSLKGGKGEPGSGEGEGIPGEKGEKGDPGATPIINAEGNWEIAGVDTGISATGQDGEDGNPGLSTYEIAVQNGFDGDQEDWLDSLKGGKGEPGSGEGEGIPGEKGEKGDPGLSAYEIAVNKGFTGDQEDWLDSLKGEKGESGSSGEGEGIPGEKGEKGDPGATPIINAEGNWEIAGEDTGIPATGQDGEEGNPGLSAYEIAVENGFTGDQEDWLDSLKGEKGEPGLGIEGEGIRGEKGEKGDPGLSAYEIAVEDGFTGDQEDWLDSLKGEKGESGSGGDGEGIPGEKGEKGDPGATPIINAEGNWEIAGIDTGIPARGQDGEEGNPGLSAYEIAVENGFNRDKKDWLNSLKGEKGEPGSGEGEGIPGEKGEKGDPGATPIINAEGNWEIAGVDTGISAMGQDGEDGDPGLSAYEVAIQNGFNGDQEDWLNSLIGEKGESGDPGEMGPPGEQGEPGEDAQVQPKELIAGSLIQLYDASDNSTNGKDALLKELKIDLAPGQENEILYTQNQKANWVDFDDLAVEPWQIQETTAKARENTDHIYQMGSVAIGKTKAIEGVMLDVEGSIRGGAASSIGTIGNPSFAFGYESRADHEYTFAFGFQSRAYGKNSFATGSRSLADGEYSRAMGLSTTAHNRSETVVGEYNAITKGRKDALTTGNPLFQVGNGHNSTTGRNNAFTVLVDGATGIGIDGNENDAKPTAMLDVGKGEVRIRDLPATAGAPTYKAVVVDGNGILHSIDPGNASDRRLKKEIKSLPPVLPAFDDIQAYTYRFKSRQFSDKNLPDGQQIGLLAQELEKYFPELVATDNEGFKSIHYAQVTVILVAAIREQQALIKEVRKENKELLKRMELLEEKMLTQQKQIENFKETLKVLK